ncbi:ABC transporter substrate-binding protein [Prosthecomicrobium pneumaticum]|uniref:ABC-type nitrate/sulfonate/bicarbonate transport system substrate-binding protein n=1 Tax=Prosthecomicrobium pneumaticum TaxID=81895 RepID=A0A7W9L409_9HYPH|nr:ABC transporter substrate-binding protein [Prosthecomicrobium pneumaticum]MBB5755107.1 ABC-type nitrate/sulfonate/bicarbonate transport system substrate-binding protein [Prosthecomicrobium pneumaticum]
MQYDRRLIRFGAAMLLAGASLFTGAAFAQTAPEIPSVEVRYGHLPYYDHTQAIIGLDKGWFKEVGITFTPDDRGIVVNAEDGPGVFASGRVDVLSGSAQMMLPAIKSLPPFKVFFYADIFQGYAIMAQADSGAKSFAEFVAEGQAPDEAYRSTMAQLKGKRFAFPTEAAIKGFIDLALQKGALTLADVDAVGAPGDSANVALMQAGRADFQVGGVPSRMTLETAGFKPILTSGDLAAYAAASPDSVELRAVFHDGWLASDAWIEANYDTVLRIASVGFRINQFIADHPDDAAAIHTPFLNSVAGTSFENAMAKVAYSGLDPFWTFDQQEGWILDKANPLNAEYVIGSAIKIYEEQGLFQPGEVKWDQTTVAQKVYADLLDYKKKTDEILAGVEGKDLSAEAGELIEKAKAFYAAFDFLDAYRFASAATGG